MYSEIFFFLVMQKMGEEGPSFRVETSCSIKRLLEDEELCCWLLNIFSLVFLFIVGELAPRPLASIDWFWMGDTECFSLLALPAWQNCVWCVDVSSWGSWEMWVRQKWGGRAGREQNNPSKKSVTTSLHKCTIHIGSHWQPHPAG